MARWRNVLRLVRSNLLVGYRPMFDADRAARKCGQSPDIVSVVAGRLFDACAPTIEDSWRFVTEAASTTASSA